MWQSFIAGFDEAILSHEGDWTLEAVVQLMHRLTPLVEQVWIRPPAYDAPPQEETLPWGRFLLHAEASNRYNVQLDTFSSEYTGAIHAHGTFGIFWVIQGSLKVWDYAETPEGIHLIRAGIATAGCASCFCPPQSDWHRVGTPAYGPQTVSIHLYGPGFDLDQGIALDELGQPRTYTRGPLQPLEALQGRLGWGG